MIPAETMKCTQWSGQEHQACNPQHLQIQILAWSAQPLGCVFGAVVGVVLAPVGVLGLTLLELEEGTAEVCAAPSALLDTSNQMCSSMCSAAVQK